MRLSPKACGGGDGAVYISQYFVNIKHVAFLNRLTSRLTAIIEYMSMFDK